MQGNTFQFNVKMLKLGDHDIILGVDRMKSSTPVTFDFEGN